MGSLFAVLELQENESHEPNKMVQAFGKILHAMTDVVESFYNAYNTLSNDDVSALLYRSRWEKTSPRLFRKYLMNNPQDCNLFLYQADIKRDYRGFNDIFHSGSFFANLPQVRPLPFNGKTDYRNKHRDYGSCSTHYENVRPDFTPGAITFFCACTHPIIFGFMVLERGEGPRAVLDVLISRFPVLPIFVIYDFACGLLQSAQHTLWWATKNNTFVSDRFHIDNHNCHRGFHPDSHNYLNGRNTVSHEKRNRPIATLKESLGNCPQTLYISLLAYHSLYLN